MRSRLNVLAVLVAAFVLGAPAAAPASQNQLSILMDDDLMVYRNDATRDAALRQAKQIGVDYVRVTLLWSVVAENARKGKARDKRFRRLGADDPRAYPRLNWDRYDRLVKAGQTLGVGIFFNVTGPGPSWGHKKVSKRASLAVRRSRRAWKPKAKEFYKFVQAVGKRYSGGYRDENDGRPVIPKVSFWSIWNEPNQASWLAPQWEGGKPASPHLYRELYDHGRRALISKGHASSTILVGETAPLGLSRPGVRQPMRPKLFIREFFCVDGALAPLTGSAATRKGCKFFDKKPIEATGWAHHPYTKKTPPTSRDPHPDSIVMGNFSELYGMLDTINANTARVRQGMSVISTEFGYETNPPDPFHGATLDQQADWITLGEYLAFSDERILGNTQFILQDVAPRSRNKKGSKAYWSTYQSGLFDQQAQAKPAVTAYMLPFLAYNVATAESGRTIAAFWGQLRFRPNDLPPEAYDRVQLQYKPVDGSADWAPMGDPITVTSGKGFFQGTVEMPGPGYVRAHWEGPSPDVAVDSRPAIAG